MVPAFVAFVGMDAAVQCNGESDAHCWLPLDEAIPLLPFGGQRELFQQIHRDFIESPPPPALRIPLGDTGAQDPEVGTMGATPD